MRRRFATSPNCDSQHNQREDVKCAVMPAESASFPCRLCGNSGLTPYYTLGPRGQFRYYRCPTCTLVNYDLSGGLDQRQYVELVDPRDDRAERNRDKDATWRFVEMHLPLPTRFLDIGCGSGRLLHLAKRSGSIVKGTAEDRYDLITLRHVLEHLPDSRS